jgi:putative GTP pyrophosphokinase
MTFPVPKFSKTQINQAGEFFRTIHLSKLPNFEKWLEAYKVLSNFRVSHSYPINTFNSTLRKKLKRIDPDALVAQRLKRTPSILHKLDRFPQMQLSRMQDIGGLRAIVGSVKELEQLYQVYKSSRFGHELVSEYDYVSEPKSSGYRSIHLVYRYKNDKQSVYDGIQIELQFRTKLQHIWATAVETAGTFLEHSLKSSEGPDEWLKFFALAGSAFSYLENSKPVPGFEHMNKQETFLAVTKEAERLDIRNILVGYSKAVQAIPKGTANSAYYLVELDLTGEQKSVTVTTFNRESLQEANEAYSAAEQRATLGEVIQVVLVSAGSIKSLKLAYPNYFLDTHDFLLQLKRIEKMAERLS